MNSHDIQNLRNIGIMAHIDAGKTTTTERILYYTGLTHKIGEVHNGDTIMDWMVQEQDRGITITSAATSCVWNNHRITIIDTPGHVDFTVEVERCLRILDGAIFILDAKEGVEAQTKVVWHQADHYKVPRLIFINKMDIVGADFMGCVTSIRDELGGNPLPIQMPIGCEKEFAGVICLMTMKAYYNTGELGKELQMTDIPEIYLDEAMDRRKHLVETLADVNDDLMMLYLEGEEIPLELLMATLRKATLEGKIIPVLCGSAFTNKGVQLLLDAIIHYLPSPIDRPIIKGHGSDGKELSRKPNKSQPFSALIFKVISDPYVGRLTYFRVYSGSIKTGASVLNVSKNKKVRANKLLQMHANNRTEIDVAHAGDIVAAIGLKYTGTGSTLSDLNHPILLESIDFPEPVISRALEAKKPSDYDKMRESLEHLAEEDPTLITYVNSETGQTIISGMGELHLEIILDRLVKEFGVACNSGKPQVTHKESITKAVTVDYKLTQLGATQTTFAYIKLKVTPKERGSGHSINTSYSDKRFPNHFIRSAEEGVKQSLLSGIISGYEVIDIDVDICDLAYIEEQSTEVAFATAAAYALTEALKQGDSRLLEPIVTVNAHAPETYIGDIMDDLKRRKGSITAMEVVPNGHKIIAIVPLSQMFGYATVIRSITRGNGHYTMIFSHFGMVDK